MSWRTTGPAGSGRSGATGAVDDGVPSTSARDGVVAVTERWALRLRLVAGIGAGGIGLATPGPVSGVPVLLVLLAWSTFRLLTGRLHHDRRLLLLDMAVILGVGLATPLLISSPAEVRSLASIPAAVVAAASATFVWQLRGWRVVLWCAAAVAATAVGGSLVAGVGPGDVLVAWFLPLQTLLVWPQMVVLRRGAGRADREAAALAETRTAALLAARRRDAEREHWAVLHDTASATLLMVGTGVPASAAGRVRAQAARDLAALDAAVPSADPPRPHPDEPVPGTPLLPLLRPLAEEAGLSVAVEGPDDLRVPHDVAAAVRDATRELLTNVERHAGVGRARVRTGRDEPPRSGVWVEVHDEGRGFDAAAVEGRGLRESVRGRIGRVGGTVDVASAPGGGSTVRLAWAPPARPGQAAPTGGSLAGELTRSYRLLLVLIVAVSAAFRMVSAHAASPYGPLETAYLALAVTVMVLVALAAARRRPVAPVVTAVAAAAFALDVALAVQLGPAGIGGVQDWTAQSAGWLWFFTVGVQQRSRLLVLLCAPYVVRAAVLLPTGDLDGLRPVAVFGLGLVVLQLGTALFLRELEARAARAERQRDELLAVLATATVADGLLVDFRARSRALRATTVPLLRELADGAADPGDETTRHRARIEGARLRRLFAEADAVDASLSAEVRAVVEQVERSGVSTALEVGATPQLGTEARRALLEEPMAALALARARAKVVVQLVGGQVVVSVTTDGPAPLDPPPGSQHGVSTIRASVADRTWVQSSLAAAAPADPARTTPADLTAPAPGDRAGHAVGGRRS